MRRRLLQAAAGAVLLAVTVPFTGQPVRSLRAAFYYPWYPENWAEGVRDRPSLGLYDSGRPGVAERHIASMLHGHIDVGIASWWGQGSRTDGRVPRLLEAAEATPFRWTVMHELEGYEDPSPDQLRSDLVHIRDRYSRHPRYLWIGGRFVVFVWGEARAEDCSMVDRWRQANAGIDAFLMMNTLPGFADCPSQPDGWFGYGPFHETLPPTDAAYTISPGYLRASDTVPCPGHDPPRCLTRDLARWRRAVAAMVDAREPWHLVTTFNEWFEASGVESAVEWASPSGHGDYLDALHDHPERRSARE